jgi:hypothetical protein
LPAAAVPITPASGHQLVPLVNWVEAQSAPLIQTQIAQLLATFRRHGTAAAGGALAVDA